jgi:hypothetical protein
MLEKITQLISQYPRHYSKMIQANQLMLGWVQDHSKIESKDFAARVYSAISQQTNICEHGQTRKFKNIQQGFVGRGPVSGPTPG